MSNPTQYALPRAALSQQQDIVAGGYDRRHHRHPVQPRLRLTIRLWRARHCPGPRHWRPSTPPMQSPVVDSCRQGSAPTIAAPHSSPGRPSTSSKRSLRATMPSATAASTEVSTASRGQCQAQRRCLTDKSLVSCKDNASSFADESSAAASKLDGSVDVRAVSNFSGCAGMRQRILEPESVGSATARLLRGSPAAAAARQSATSCHSAPPKPCTFAIARSASCADRARHVDGQVALSGSLNVCGSNRTHPTIRSRKAFPAPTAIRYRTRTCLPIPTIS